MMLISGSTDYTGFEQVDIVVEAVFEDLALKQQMVAEVEANCATHTVFASIPPRCLSAASPKKPSGRSR